MCCWFQEYFSIAIHEMNKKKNHSCCWDKINNFKFDWFWTEFFAILFFLVHTNCHRSQNQQKKSDLFVVFFFCFLIDKSLTHLQSLTFLFFVRSYKVFWFYLSTDKCIKHENNVSQTNDENKNKIKFQIVFNIVCSSYFQRHFIFLWFSLFH